MYYVSGKTKFHFLRKQSQKMRDSLAFIFCIIISIQTGIILIIFGRILVDITCPSDDIETETSRNDSSIKTASNGSKGRTKSVSNAASRSRSKSKAKEAMNPYFINTLWLCVMFYVIASILSCVWSWILHYGTDLVWLLMLASFMTVIARAILLIIFISRLHYVFIGTQFEFKRKYLSLIIMISGISICIVTVGLIGFYICFNSCSGM